MSAPNFLDKMGLEMSQDERNLREALYSIERALVHLQQERDRLISQLNERHPRAPKQNIKVFDPRKKKGGR